MQSTRRRTGMLAGWVALAACSGLVLPGPACGAKTGLKSARGDAGPPIEDATVPPACGDFSVRGSLAALDVYIAMDTSGSMDQPTAEGTRKIDAVREALATFLQAPESAGIGVAMSFFPILNPGVPDLCASDVGCGEPGACQPASLCYPGNQLFCSDTSECPAGQTCERLGVCVGSVDLFCVPGLLDCSSGTQCVPAGVCANTVKCAAEDYLPSAEPAVLPDGASGLVALLNGRPPEGGTPTLPALEGVIQAAVARSQQLSDHKSIVLLATDGFPTSCDPAIPISSQPSSAGIAALVGAAEAGRGEGVQTFVIGVFGPDEAAIAEQNLDTIAEGGGTTSSYIVSTDQPVAEEFLASLNAVRAAATACDYALPRPGDVPLEGALIEVWLVRPGEETQLVARRPGECDPFTGGFSFDRDPFGPVPPARVQLCPASCARVRGDPNLDIEVRVPCPR